MVRKLYLGLFILVVLINSCQKEIHFATEPSVGSLIKDSSGGCLPANLGAGIVVGRDLSDSNFIEVSVEVSGAGSYEIRTDTVNGYYFRASGVFQDPGHYTVRLKGSGQPQAVGASHFTVHYGSSSCVVTVNSGYNLNQPALFTLSGSSGTCMNYLVSGTYVPGIATDTSCKVRIEVDVSQPGFYNIPTLLVNGYKFSGAGQFTQTGVQFIYLNASGTPVTAGSDLFTVSTPNSSCTFVVPVLLPYVAVNPDHFPLTAGSYWSYGDPVHLQDSSRRTVVDTASFHGFLYRVVKELVPFSQFNYFFRKTGSEYFEYCRADKYTSSVQYADPLMTDLPFLKEGLVTGENWQSTEYSAPASFGQVILIRYLYSCIDANAVLTINGHAFSNVYKIRMRPQVSAVGGSFNDTGEVYQFAYAKGVGIIDMKKDNNGFNGNHLMLKEWNVQ
jgi:hypothetical protein